MTRKYRRRTSRRKQNAASTSSTPCPLSPNEAPADNSQTGPHSSPPGDLQLTLDREEMVDLLQTAVHSFAVEVGLKVARLLLRDEVDQLCGPRYQRPEQRVATRHGSQPGYVVIAGQKLPVDRPRVRSVDQKTEIPLPIYAQLQKPDAMPDSALKQMVHGVSCRNYERTAELAREAFGVKRSSVSRAFVAASAREVAALAERTFHGQRMIAIFIDGVDFAGEMLLAAVGVTESGQKLVLGVRQGATENAAVATALLEDLAARGVDPALPTLFVLDGAKALHAAVRRVWGTMAVIQRCQLHKERNVKAHVPMKHRDELCRRLSNAYGEANYTTARAELEGTVSWLAKINPDAAASLQEGLEETLTVTHLGLGRTLRRSFGTTNAIESAFRQVRRMASRVTKWQDGDMRRRWCTTALLDAENRFQTVMGCRQLGSLVEALDIYVQATGRGSRPCKIA